MDWSDMSDMEKVTLSRLLLICAIIMFAFALVTATGDSIGSITFNVWLAAGFLARILSLLLP